METWQIRRGDKRDRCGHCLKVFKTEDLKIKFGSPLLRFPNAHLECHKIRKSEENML